LIKRLTLFRHIPGTASQQQQQQQQKPDIKGSNIYQTHTMTLGNNIKNLVIVLPNEGHEDPNAKPKDLRIVNQPYLPQNAVINAGTTVTLFNADVGHHHQLTLVNNNSKIVCIAVLSQVPEI
jgi:hypothetical protein